MIWDEMHERMERRRREWDDEVSRCTAVLFVLAFQLCFNMFYHVHVGCHVGFRFIFSALFYFSMYSCATSFGIKNDNNNNNNNYQAQTKNWGARHRGCPGSGVTSGSKGRSQGKARSHNIPEDIH